MPRAARPTGGMLTILVIFVSFVATTVFVPFVAYIVFVSFAVLRGYIRKTPNFAGGIGALNAAEMPRASASRVFAGSRMPSSHSRAVE